MARKSGAARSHSGEEVPDRAGGAGDREFHLRLTLRNTAGGSLANPPCPQSRFMKSSTEETEPTLPDRVYQALASARPSLVPDVPATRPRRPDFAAAVSLSLVGEN